MLEKVKVYDKEGNLIREGSPRNYRGVGFWSITAADLMKFGGIVVTGFLLVGRIEARTTRNEGDIETLLKATAKLTDFVKNSDGWHGALTGSQFENGKPLNNNFDPRKARGNYDSQ